jgi:hypothetical protein
MFWRGRERNRSNHEGDMSQSYAVQAMYMRLLEKPAVALVIPKKEKAVTEILCEAIPLGRKSWIHLVHMPKMMREITPFHLCKLLPQVVDCKASI